MNVIRSCMFMNVIQSMLVGGKILKQTDVINKMYSHDAERPKSSFVNYLQSYMK